MEWLITILVFLAVLVVTAVLFVGWVIMLMVRGVTYGVMRLFGHRPPGARAGARTVICPRDRCQGPNPPEARFCRRCGRMLVTERQVVSRAAVW